MQPIERDADRRENLTGRLGGSGKVPGEQTWVAWQLTELGRIEGVDIIRGL